MFQLRSIINPTIVLLAVFCLSSCPSGDDSGGGNNAAAPGGDPAVSSGSAGGSELAGGEDNPCAGEAAPVAVEDASEIYASNQCVMCHGKEMEGSGLGPALSNIAAEWDEAELKTYIRNAEQYVDSGNRLTHDPKYVMKMPPFPGSEDDLDKLVKWLLTK